ncbi:glycosyltransferase [Reichenbachiella agarivorans]|uniref:Glycosyltransferase n=1 Tax=Reichenbachiella agarivorans TaxID=2979464 RepID=A0ABY6CUI7_9BACT|nr:glycosyltransferase [Reichenbachiella agarivorans]UXP33554.1 glycosyltransferase [Reichenbachiella agarivorans]
MIKITFIILHYQTIDDTIECIDSLHSIDSTGLEWNIVVVDNCSPNKTGLSLKERYQSERVHVIISNANLGFARGNNLGCKYALDHFNPNFLIVTNNDIVINQNNFFHLLIETYRTTKFNILGPDIISLVDEKHQSPVGGVINSRKKILKVGLINIFLYLSNILFLDKYISILLNSRRAGAVDESKTGGKKLHGAALIFHESYFKRFESVFFERTFMFVEEDILYHRCATHNLKMIYDHELKVYHKEDSATNSVLVKERAKRRFVYKESIKSLFVYFVYFHKI